MRGERWTEVHGLCTSLGSPRVSPAGSVSV